jgi:hypothetical protein
MSLRERWRLLRRKRTDSTSTNSAEMRKRALENKIGLFEWTAHGCAVVVIFGVVKEFGSKFGDFIHNPSWSTFDAISGGFFVAAGIAGEVLASMLQHGFEKRLDRLNDQTIAELNLEAEKERTARAKLEARVIRRSVRRRFDDEEAKSFAELLRKHLGQPFTLRVNRTRLELNDMKPQEMNSEQASFVMQLRQILWTAGWVDENIANLPDFRVSKGLTIFCRELEASHAVAELAKGLGKLDIECQVSVQPKDFLVQLVICVGLL